MKNIFKTSILLWIMDIIIFSATLPIFWFKNWELKIKIILTISYGILIIFCILNICRQIDNLRQQKGESKNENRD